jgi:hypothetical protein
LKSGKNGKMFCFVSLLERIIWRWSQIVIHGHHVGKLLLISLWSVIYVEWEKLGPREHASSLKKLGHFGSVFNTIACLWMPISQKCFHNESRDMTVLSWDVLIPPVWWEISPCSKVNVTKMRALLIWWGDWITDNHAKEDSPNFLSESSLLHHILFESNDTPSKENSSRKCSLI